MRVWLPLLLAVAVAGCGHPLGHDGGDEMAVAVDSYLRKHQFNGAALIAHRGEVVLSRGYGVADAATGRPNTVDTIFPIASITKPFTALAILQLEERGLLDVQDPVSEYAPEFPDAERFTIHHLLTHTSGLPRDLSDNAVVTDDADVDGALAAYPGAPLAFEPGTAFQYSNLAYYVLSLIIERVSGQSYEEYLREAVFEPLGMERTGVAVEPLVDPRAATGYRGDADSGDAVPPLHASWWKGGGGMYSTVGDLYRWERALTSGELLGVDGWRRMHAIQSASSDLASQGYGYGWQIIEPQQVVWHGGDLDPGYHGWLFRDMSHDLTIVALSNDDAWRDRGTDLVLLYERGRDIERSRLFPALPYVISITAALGSVMLSLAMIVALARRRRRLSRPGVIRFVAQVVVPLAIAIPVLFLGLDSIRTAGSWTALTIVAPAVAWLSASLFLVAALLLVVAAYAFARPAG